MAVPLATTRGLQAVRTFVLMAMLAQLGHDTLAASALISSIQIAIVVSFISCFFALGSIVGREFAAKNFSAIGIILQQSWILSSLFSIVMIIVYLFMGSILHAMHQPAELIPYVSKYFAMMTLGAPAIFAVVICQQFLCAIKKQLYVTIVNVVGLFFTIILGYGLIFGHFGLPKLGVSGAALAIAIRLWATLVIYLVIIKSKQFNKYKIFSIRLKDSFKWLKLIMRVGFPIAMGTASNMLVILIYVTLIGWLGQESLAANQIVNQYIILSIVLMFGISEASGIVVGHAYGERNFSTINQLGWLSVACGMAVTVIGAILFITFMKPLADVFLQLHEIDGQAIYKIVQWVLLLRAFGMLFDGTADILIGALRGLYDTTFPMLVGWVTAWLISVPLGYYLGFTMKLGLLGVSLGIILAMIINALLLMWRWHRKTKLLEYKYAGE